MSCFCLNFNLKQLKSKFPGLLSKSIIWNSPTYPSTSMTSHFMLKANRVLIGPLHNSFFCQACSSFLQILPILQISNQTLPPPPEVFPDLKDWNTLFFILISIASKLQSSMLYMFLSLSFYWRTRQAQHRCIFICIRPLHSVQRMYLGECSNVHWFKKTNKYLILK